MDQLRPLDQADAVSKEIVVISDLLHFFHIADAVYIEVVQRQSSFFIDLHNGKRGTADRFLYPKTSGKALGKYRFPDP